MYDSWSDALSASFPFWNDHALAFLLAQKGLNEKQARDIRIIFMIF
jgi:hypothetical protein